MKTIFNNKPSGKIIIAILIIIIFVLIGFFLLKKLQQIEKDKLLSREIAIDTVTDSRALGYTGQRKIAKDSLGNIFVGYRKDYQKNAEIFIAKISQGTTGFKISDTEKPIAVIDNNNDQRVPSLAIDSKDTLHAVWYGSDTEKVKNNRQIKYARRTSKSNKWESWRNIAFVNGFDNKEDYWQEHPMILAGLENTLYVVWEGKDEQNKNQQIKFIRSDNGGTIWSSWKNIAPTKKNTQSRPTLVQDKNGKLFLFIYSSQENENDLQQIQYTTSSDKGETWTPWQAISDRNFDSRHVSAAIDESGIVHIAWRAKTSPDGPAQIIYRTLSDNKLSNPITVFPSEKYQFFPSVGTTDSGIVYISWMDNSDPSEFPRENPTSGASLISFFKKGKFQPPVKLSTKDNLLYPNASERVDDEKLIPIFYAEEQDGEKFDLKLKFLDGTK